MPSLDEVSRAIGALQAQTKALTDAQEKHGAETTAMRKDVADMKTSLALIETNVKSFAPAAKKIQKWEQRAIGVSLVGGLLGGTALAYIRGKLGL